MGVTSRDDALGAAYRREELTWRLFAGLTAFGFLNAVLGPALPYLRSIEHISYVTGALHQVAFAIGGGVAGALAAGGRGEGARARIIPAGLTAAALASVGLAYGASPVVTIAAAFAMSLFATSALIRMWAVLSDLHGPRRTIALTEGEVLVSVGSIATPLLVAALAATALTWRGAVVVGGIGVVASVAGLRSARLPDPSRPHELAGSRRARMRMRPTLLIVFAIVGLEFALSFWLATYLHDTLGVARGVAVLMVSGLYAANLVGRVTASRAARRLPDAAVLGGALALALIGLPLLLVARSPGLAAIGIALAGIGIGAMFPLTSSLHVASAGRSADSSVAEVITVASLGQIAGPLAAGILAQASDLRVGLLVLPALTLVGLAGLGAHQRLRR